MRTDTVLHVLATARDRLGIDPREALGRVRSGQVALSGQERVPVSVLHELWESTAHRHRLSLPALAAESLPLEALGPFGVCLLTAPSGLSAIELAAWAFPTINDDVRWQVHTGASVVVELLAPAPASFGEAASQEAMVMHFALGARRIAAVAPVRVQFRHAPSASARTLAAALRAPVEWSAPRVTLELPRAALEAPPPQTSPQSSAVLRAHLAAELERLAARRATVAEQARRAVSAVLDRGVTGANLARQLGRSERSLRRQLARQDTSLRRLRDETRLARAHALLADPAWSILEISLELGFADASTFARAFRRWTGVSPSELRGRGPR